MMRLALLPVVLVSLAACDVATEVAVDAISSEVRTRYIAECQSVAEGAGISSEMIDQACECSADEFAADMREDGELQLDEARIEQVLRTCVQEQQGAAEDAPAESTNG